MDFTKYRKIVVHHSRPHFDDCMCVAMMKIINPKIKISRKNTIYPDLIDDNILICDIGHGKYDHHQIDTETHLDGSKYCACTLLYRDIKDLLFTNKTAQSNFEQILTDIEYNDNTPNDKHLSIEMEYDIIAGKTTSKLWKTTNKNTFQHGCSIVNEFKKAYEEKYESMDSKR